MVGLQITEQLFVASQLPAIASLDSRQLQQMVGQLQAVALGSAALAVVVEHMPLGRWQGRARPVLPQAPSQPFT